MPPAINEPMFLSAVRFAGASEIYVAIPSRNDSGHWRARTSFVMFVPQTLVNVISEWQARKWRTDMMDDFGLGPRPRSMSARLRRPPVWW